MALIDQPFAWANARLPAAVIESRQALDAC